MRLEASHRVARARQFLRSELWEVEPEPRSWASRGLAVLQLGVMIGQGFVRDHLLLRASALTYFTILSLIPLLAIATSIASAVGVTSNLSRLVVEQIAAGTPEVQDRIIELVQRPNFGALGGVGAAVLFVLTVLGISNIERSLNHIWGVKQQRSLGRRFTDYLAVLVVAPLLLGSALSLSTTLQSQWLVQKLVHLPGLSVLYDLGLGHAPTLVLAVAFAFLYWFLPNTSVRPAAALLGGVVAGVLVEVALTVYLGFSVGAARADAFFGGFAQLPLLLLWIYMFWAVVLLGAEVAFAYQNRLLYQRQVRGRSPGPAEREAVGLRIALEGARAFRDRAEPWTSDALAEKLGVPVRTVRDVVAHLLRAGIVTTLGPPKEDAIQIGRPAEHIAVVDVLGALRGERGSTAGGGEVGAAVERVLAELDEGESKAAVGKTLGDLLQGIPAPRSQ